MVLRAYSIFDKKALCYHPPFFAVTDGSAVRSFSDLANDVATAIGRHPGDYSLWQVAAFDDSSGQFMVVQPSLFVADAAHLVERQKPLFQQEETV